MAMAWASEEEAAEAVSRGSLHKRSPERYRIVSQATFSAGLERLSSGAATMDELRRQRMFALMEEHLDHADYELLWNGGSAPCICQGELISSVV
ncbi:hypothetical protein ACQJBY_045134 [Aegilops geniculata]